MCERASYTITPIQHALSLPGFLLLGSDIWSKMLSFSASGIPPCVFFTVYRDPLDSRYCFLHSRTNLELWICQPSKNVGLPAGQLYYSVSYKCMVKTCNTPRTQTAEFILSPMSHLRPRMLVIHPRKLSK